MNPDEYRVMYDLEDSYWWFVGKDRIMCSLLDLHVKGHKALQVLDVGCGTGRTMEKLEKYGKVYGIDMAVESIHFCKKRRLHNVRMADADDIPFNDNQFDIIVASDIIEHTRDDRRVVKELLRVLKPQGILFVNVPAFRFLWSKHDVALHHFRRYTLPQIRRLLRGEGFKILKISYSNFFLFLPVFVVRTTQNMFIGNFHRGDAKTSHMRFPRLINNFLLLIYSTEAVLLRYLDFPFGVSVTCIARKP
jgi:ubiquinone/menaquinone biosynthesis C-methylase UbiE